MSKKAEGALTIFGFASLVLVIGLVVRAGDLDNQWKLLLLMGTGLAVAVALVSPRLGVAGLVLLSAFTIQVSIAGTSLRVGDAALLLVGATLLLSVGLRKHQIPRLVQVAWDLVLIGAALSALIAGGRGLSVPGVASVFACWALFRAAWVSIDLPRDTFRMFLPVAGVLIVISSGYIAQARGWLSPIVGVPYLPDRLDSTMGYYTVAAGMLIMCSLGLLGLSLTPTVSRGGRIVTGALSLWGMTMVALSQSRGALAALAAGLTYLAVALSRHRIVAAAAAVSAAIAFYLVLSNLDANSESALDRLARTIQYGEQGGDDVRRQLQAFGLRLSLDHPFGVGYGNFSEYLTGPDAFLVLFHSHSLFVQVALDIGWIGFFGWLTLMLYAPIHQALQRPPRSAAFSVGAASGLVAGLVQGVGDYLYHESGYLVLTTYLAAVAIRGSTWSAEDSEAPARLVTSATRQSPTRA